MILVHKRYRVCADCRCVLAISQFYRRKEKGRAVPDSYCRPCRRERSKAAYLARSADPVLRQRANERDAARKRERRRADPEYAERLRANARAWRAGQSEEQRVALAQNRRIRQALERERQGLAPAVRHSPRALGAFQPARQASRLDPGPLLKAIPADWHGNTESQNRAINRMRTGENKHVTLAVADELLCALGKPHLLPILYG